MVLISIFCVFFSCFNSYYSFSISSKEEQKTTTEKFHLQVSAKYAHQPKQFYWEDSSKAQLITTKSAITSKQVRDSTSILTKKLTKHLMVGNCITVPANKKWKIKRVFVTNGIGGGYNILIGSDNYKNEYYAGEKIYAPAWSAESSLLTEDGSTVSYILEIVEENFNKEEKK